jgi:hypothetical protein
MLSNFINRLMDQARDIILRGMLRPYPTKIFAISNVQAAFTELNDTVPNGTTITLDLSDPKSNIPVSSVLNLKTIFSNKYGSSAVRTSLCHLIQMPHIS